MEEVSIRMAIDLDLFNILVNAGKPQTLEDLTKASGADGVLLGMPLADLLHIDHLLRYLAAGLLRSLGAVGAVGEFGEIGKEAYTATKVTKTFMIPQLAAGVEVWYVTIVPYRLVMSRRCFSPCFAAQSSTLQDC